MEAWTPGSSGSSSGGINWLVTDQLGTPRMVIDQSGSLASVKRHDYLPFGEELFNGARTTTMGYAANDTTRQKFTDKERDNETGLDYFETRYYVSNIGRFTTPDSFGGLPLSPQTFNLYAYVGNNPLKFVDPTGHFSVAAGERSRWQRKQDEDYWQRRMDEQHYNEWVAEGVIAELFGEPTGGNSPSSPQNPGSSAIPTDANDRAMLAVLLGEASTPGEGSWGPEESGPKARKNPSRVLSDDDVYGEMTYMIFVVDNRLHDWGQKQGYSSWKDVIEKSPDFKGYIDGKNQLNSIGAQTDRAKIALAAIADYRAHPLRDNPNITRFYYWKGIKQTSRITGKPIVTARGHASRFANTDFSVNDHRY